MLAVLAVAVALLGVIVAFGALIAHKELNKAVKTGGELRDSCEQLMLGTIPQISRGMDYTAAVEVRRYGIWPWQREYLSVLIVSMPSSLSLERVRSAIEQHAWCFVRGPKYGGSKVKLYFRKKPSVVTIHKGETA